MTTDYLSVARVAGVPTVAESASPSAPATAAGFTTTVRRANEIPSFETVVTRAAAEKASGQPAAATAAAPLATQPVKRAEKAQKSFEAFALQVFIGSMLPKENTKLFGTGSAGKMWQAMLAEKLADQIVASGRLKLLPQQPATESAAMTAAPVDKTMPAAPGGDRTEIAKASNAAFQAQAVGLGPSRGGGTR